MISGKIVEEMEGDLFAAPLSMALGQPKKKEHLSSEMTQGLERERARDLEEKEKKRV